MESIWQWLNENGGALGIVLALVPIVWGALTYINIKRAEERQRRFENYHSLIKQLVQGDSSSDFPYMDRQLAVVFKLQKYPEYAPATRRILIGFREIVQGWHHKAGSARLIEQIDETLRRLEWSSRSGPFH